MIQILDKHKARLIVSVTVDGKRMRKTKTVEYKGKRDLQNQYDEFEEEVKGTPLTDITVSKLLSAYIDKRKRLGIKPTTEVGYRTCEKRIFSLVDGILAKNLTTYQVEEIIASMARKYSSKTVANTINLLSAAYDDAIRIELLTKNPCKNATLPKKENTDKLIFSEDEVWKFVKALENEMLDYKVGYELCLFCGLRRSEVLGLRESSIDFKSGCIRIAKTRHYVDGKTVVQDTKTAGSQRVLAVPGAIMKDIKKLMDEHEAFPYEKTDYLIQNGFGQPIPPATFTNHLPRIEKANGLPLVSVHGLRHTFASMLNADGIDIARISAELGHSTIGTTLNIYTHVFGGTTASSRGIADGINKRFRKSGTNEAQAGNEKASEC